MNRILPSMIPGLIAALLTAAQWSYASEPNAVLVLAESDAPQAGARNAFDSPRDLRGHTPVELGRTLRPEGRDEPGLHPPRLRVPYEEQQRLVHRTAGLRVIRLSGRVRRLEACLTTGDTEEA